MGTGVGEGVNVGISVAVGVGEGVGEEARRRGGGREVAVLVRITTGEAVASDVASCEATIGWLLQAVSRPTSVIRDK